MSERLAIADLRSLLRQAEHPNCRYDDALGISLKVGRELLGHLEAAERELAGLRERYNDLSEKLERGIDRIESRVNRIEGVHGA